MGLTVETVYKVSVCVVKSTVGVEQDLTTTTYKVNVGSKSHRVI